MVMLASDTPVTTVEQLLALPEDGMRHELLRGAHVMTPGLRMEHQDGQWVLTRRIANFVEPLAHLRGYQPPSDILLGPDTLVQPDISVFRIDPSNPPKSWNQLDAPELVVEILSPGTAGRDRGAKREIYQAAGVAEYWIVDIDSRLIERWTPEDERPQILRDKIEWQPDERGDVLLIELKEIWPESI